MQVENEYGYYGDDTNYMKAMKQLMLENGRYGSPCHL